MAAAAYRAGEVLANEAEERLLDFGGRRDIVVSEIRLPAGGVVAEIIGADEICEVGFELLMTIVVVAFYGRLLD